ncbi:Acidobacterial duplicated orphan permease (function unknown) [Olavius sp. associated proteobacterium Delta 1]|nr:Acidobacterial duplicated orphan permease (function unknown) [Olavius sp. associated proteobacterium Delta 1]
MNQQNAAMFKNYLTVAVRNILKHKGYSIINIVGLAIGLAIFILIASFVDFHLSFDDFHKSADQIYSVIQVLPSGKEGEHHTGKIPAPLLPFLRDELPEIESALRWIPTNRWIIRHKGQKYYADEGTVWAVDPNFFSFFSFELITGNPNTALTKPQSVVLTESIARKYFGEENPVGKKLTLGSLPDFIVSGVAKDVPINSSFPFDLLVSLNSFGWQKNWRMNCATFVQFGEQVDPEKLKHKLLSLVEKQGSKLPDRPLEMYLQPLSDLYLESAHIKGLWRQESRFMIYLTLAIGIVLLVVVCFNFINLATAQYFSRTKEVGVRKVVGGTQPQLRWQFLGESMLLALIAFPLSLILYEIMRPLFIFLMTHDPNSAYPGLRDNSALFFELIGVTLLVGILAGCYPAIFLSRLHPVQILKGGPLTGKKGARLRQILVVTQFAASIFAVLIALTIFNHYNFLSTLDLGFKKNNVLIVELGTNYHNALLQPIKRDLMRHPDIKSVSAATWIPVNWNNEGQVIRVTPAGEMNMAMNTYGIDYDFIELLEMEIVDGRSFSANQLDAANFIINVAAARELKWKYPIGKKLTVSGKQGFIVGVVKDFHFKNLFSKISPSVLYMHFSYLNVLYIKISDIPVPRVLNFIENRLQFFEPDLPFKYTLLDKRYDEWLLGTKKWAYVAGSIGMIAIFFSCLGLVGLASHTTKIRTKEIGIRKAHGATAAQIIRSLLMEFGCLIFIAVLITFPVYYIINKIVAHDLIAYFAESGFDPYTYLLAGLLALISGLAAVISQTIKVARANPVDSLRYE